MNMILVDWTRMGKTYCLAGAVHENGRYRIVRPLLRQESASPVRNVGWFPRLLDGRSRWEVFELIGVEEAKAEPPHLEDIWVRAVRPMRRSATAAERRAILEATAVPPCELPFGAPLATTRTSAYLKPGIGHRSLTTVFVQSNRIFLDGIEREGAPEPDIRVTLPVAGIGERTLPLKDHHLLMQGEHAAADVRSRVRALQLAVRKMGDRLAVRLGLSRPFQGNNRSAVCWLMADGFHGAADP